MIIYDVPSLVRRVQISEIGESIGVLLTRPYCRTSLVARNGETGCSLLLEAVNYVLPSSSADSSSRRCWSAV
jgi:hypothetical protein